MAKYTSKSYEVEAVQITAEMLEPFIGNGEDAGIELHSTKFGPPMPNRTLSFIQEGDWVVTHKSGVVVLVSNRDFERRYRKDGD